MRWDRIATRAAAPANVKGMWRRLIPPRRRIDPACWVPLTWGLIVRSLSFAALCALAAPIAAVEVELSSESDVQRPALRRLEAVYRCPSL